MSQMSHMTKFDRARAIRLLQSGLSMAKVSRQMKMAQSSFSRLVSKVWKVGNKRALKNCNVVEKSVCYCFKNQRKLLMNCSHWKYSYCWNCVLITPVALISAVGVLPACPQSCLKNHHNSDTSQLITASFQHCLLFPVLTFYFLLDQLI